MHLGFMHQLYFPVLHYFPLWFQKPGGSDTGLLCPSLTPELQTIIKEGGSCTVLDQPIPLDRLVVKSIDPLHVSGMCLLPSLRSSVGHHSFTLRFFFFLVEGHKSNVMPSWKTSLCFRVLRIIHSELVMVPSTWITPFCHPLLCHFRLRHNNKCSVNFHKK